MIAVNIILADISITHCTQTGMSTIFHIHFMYIIYITDLYPWLSGNLSPGNGMLVKILTKDGRGLALLKN